MTYGVGFGIEVLWVLPLLLLGLFWWWPSLRLRASAMSLSSSLREGITLRDESIASYEACELGSARSNRMISFLIIVVLFQIMPFFSI